MTSPSTITRDRAIDAIQLAILDLASALGALTAYDSIIDIKDHISDARGHIDTAAAAIDQI